MAAERFEITEQTLKEMEVIASQLPDDTSKLSWTQVQQVITLRSLQELLKTYGLETEFTLKVEGIKNV